MAAKKPTIRDVARRVGVHPSTVSRVLNPETRSMVSEFVATKVERAAERMGYTRSPMAAGLRTGRSHTIGVVIPDLTNPVFPPIVRAIEKVMTEAGYIALLADSANRTANEMAIFEKMKARRVDGLILATARRRDAVVDACEQDGLPVVLVNRTVDRHTVPEVVTDDALGIELAVRHLVELGHKRIAFVGGPQNTSTGRDRYRAFCALHKAGMFLSGKGLIANTRAFTEQQGKLGLLTIMKSRRKFTAVVAANDLLALGCYDALAERGMRCPEDVSVTGFNDTPFMDRMNPGLTTVRIPLAEMGEHAANLLLAVMRDPVVAAQSRSLRMEPKLVIRSSTEPRN